MLEKLDLPAATAEVPRLVRKDVELANLLASRGLSVRATLGGVERDLRLAPGWGLTQPRLGLACRLGGNPILLSIETDRVEDFLPQIAAGIHLGDLPDALALAVAEVAFRPLLDALATALADGIRLEARNDAPPVSWPVIALCPVGGHGTKPTIALHLGPEAAGAVTRHLKGLPKTPSWQDAHTAMIPLIALLGSVAIPLAELRTLDYGDVLLLPPSAAADAVQIVAGNRPRRIGTGHRAGSTITVDSLSEDAMQDSDKTDDEATSTRPDGDRSDEEDGATHPRDGGLDIDDIEIDIGFSLGHRLVSIAELRALAPGYTFELESGGTGDVGIIANGREVGRGELVRIDDRFGVRILRLIEAVND